MLSKLEFTLENFITWVEGRISHETFAIVLGVIALSLLSAILLRRGPVLDDFKARFDALDE